MEAGWVRIRARLQPCRTVRRILGGREAQRSGRARVSLVPITPSQTAPSGAEVCLCRQNNWVSPVCPRIFLHLMSMEFNCEDPSFPQPDFWSGITSGCTLFESNSRVESRGLLPLCRLISTDSIVPESLPNQRSHFLFDARASVVTIQMRARRKRGYTSRGGRCISAATAHHRRPFGSNRH